MKKTILAALAAASLSYGALAADTAPVSAPMSHLPPELEIAFDALQKELSRRLDPGKGKPVRLDQPSATAFTPAEKAALRAVFGNDRLPEVQGQKPAAKARQYQFTIPGGQYQFEDQKVNWSPLPVQVSVDATGSTSSAKWSGIEFHGLDYNSAFRDLSLSVRQQRDSLLGSVQLQAESIAIDDLTPEGTVQIDGMRYRQTLSQQKKKLDQHYDIGAKRVLVAGDVPLDDFHLAFHLRGLDPATMQQLSAAYRKPRDAGISNTVLPEIFKTLLRQGADLELSDLSVGIGGGKLRVDGVIGLPGIGAADLESESAILKALNVRLNVEVSTAMLRNATLHFARKSGKDKDPQAIEKQAQDVYSYMLGKLLSNGYATLDKDKLRAVIEIKQGMLRIGDNPDLIPLDKLRQMMDQQSDAPTVPEEEDHSAPALVRWRDRSTEHLLLFAANGESNAQRELCMRYAKEQDTEAAERWCGKVDMKVPASTDDLKEEDTPLIKDQTVSTSAPGGFYALNQFRFDPAKVRRLQIKLDHPQTHEKWAPMMRVCLHAATPSDTACINITKYNDDDQLTVYSQLSAADGKPRGERHHLARKVAIGETIELELYVDERQAHFWLGDKDDDELTEPALFPAAELSLFCSGADCSFKFE